MPVSAMASQRTLRYLIRDLFVRDFSGGLNVRDAQPELAANEQPDDWNFTFDERGGAASRLGYTKLNGTAFSGAGSGVVTNIWASTTIANYVTQAGQCLYLGTTNTIRKTFTTAARAGFADFAGKLYAIHPVDGMFSTTDGITWTALADVDAPKGTCLYVFQNKLFTNDSVNKSRVNWSAAGDGLTWAPADHNDLNEKDSEQVVALCGASGTDVALGKYGLVAFKRRSAYRINDSATGAYVTIDQRVGAASAIACVAVLGRIYTVNEFGVHWTDGFGPMRSAGDRLEPLWAPSQIDYTKIDLWCAGIRRNRIVFSLCRAGSSANDLALEHHPGEGWFAPGSNAMSAYANDANQTEKLYGGSPTAAGQVYELYKGGNDDGVAITWRLQTRWLEPAGGALIQPWRLRARGKGSATIAMRRDYSIVDSWSTALSLVEPSTLQWDTGLYWDTGLMWQAPTAEVSADVFPTGQAKAISFRFTGTTSTSDTLPPILGAAVGPEVGAFRFYGFSLTYGPLAYA